MRGLKYIIATAAAVFLLSATPNKANAQVSFGINIGNAPACPYGYYDYSPYRCAPYGYYGPEWFDGGAFVGAGPWFHSRPGWHGSVNRRYDPRYGYHGAYPHRGEAYRAPRGNWHDFHGSHVYDEHGHVSTYHNNSHSNSHNNNDHHH